MGLNRIYDIVNGKRLEITHFVPIVFVVFGLVCVVSLHIDLNDNKNSWRMPTYKVLWGCLIDPWSFVELLLLVIQILNVKDGC
jgi:hypothetical protein